MPICRITMQYNSNLPPYKKCIFLSAHSNNTHPQLLGLNQYNILALLYYSTDLFMIL